MVSDKDPWQRCTELPGDRGGSEVVGAYSVPEEAALAKIETDAQDTTVGLHEASGVNLSLPQEFDARIVQHTYFELIAPEEGNEDSYIRAIHLPANENSPLRTVLLEGGESLVNWFNQVMGQHATKGSYFVPKDKQEIFLAEGLLGSLLVRSDSKNASEVPHYRLRRGVKSADPDLPIILALSQKLLRSPNLVPELNEDAGVTHDELLGQVFDGTEYVIQGSRGRRIVHRSTLAIIDAGLQITALTGLESMPLAGLLAQIYDPSNFRQDEEVPVEEPTHISSLEAIFKPQPAANSQEIEVNELRILAKIADTWTRDMSLEIGDLLRNTDIFSALRVRMIDLKALAEEYGNVTSVTRLEKADLTDQGQSVAAYEPGAIAPKETKIGAVLLAELGAKDRQSITDYASELGSVIEKNTTYLNLPAGEVVRGLVDLGIVTYEFASVHAEEFGAFVREYQDLIRAKQSMEKSGVDTGSIQLTMEAKLLEFFIANADELRRTQLLIPEVGANMDQLLKIIELTGLKDRPLSDITLILGQVVTAQERVIKSTFPAFVKGIRTQIVEELGIVLLNPKTSWHDRTGATLYVSSEAEAERVREHIVHILGQAGVNERVIPVEVSSDRLGVSIGNRRLKDTIPQADWLPEGKPIMSRNRGH